MPTGEFSVTRTSRLFVLGLWLFEAFVHAVEIFRKAREVELFFENWGCGGQTVEEVGSRLARWNEEVEDAVELLYLLHNEYDDRYDKGYFELFGIPWEKRPHLLFYGGGWMHFMFHITRRLEGLVFEFEEIKKSQHDSISGTMPILRFAIQDGAFSPAKPEYLHDYFGMGMLHVRDEIGVLVDMCEELLDYDKDIAASMHYVSRVPIDVVRSLQEYRIQWRENRFELHHPLARKEGQVSRASQWSRFASGWLSEYAQQQSTIDGKTPEFGRFVEACSAFDKRIDISPFPIYFSNWPLRHVLWEKTVK